MTKRIFRTILATSFVVLLVGIAVIIGILYPYFGGQLEKGVGKRSLLSFPLCGKDGVAALEQLPHSSSARITLIASDGTVLYDCSGCRPDGKTMRIGRKSGTPWKTVPAGLAAVGYAG